MVFNLSNHLLCTLLAVQHLIEPLQLCGVRQYRQRSAPLSNKEYHVEFGDSTACSGSIGYAAASVGDAAV